MNLPELRTEYVDLTQAIAALEAAMENDRTEAKSIAKGLALSPEDAQVLADLEAIETRYTRRKQELSDKHCALTRNFECFQTIYDAAAQGKSTLDWMVGAELIPGALYSGWNQQWRTSDKTTHLVIKIELVEPEIQIIKETCCFHRVRLEVERNVGGYWLRVERPEYRDTCWGDLGGGDVLHRIQKKLTPVVAEKFEQVMIRFSVLA